MLAALGIIGAMVPSAPKLFITSIFPDFFRFFPVSPWSSSHVPRIPGVQTEKMGEKWGKMGKKWVKNEVTGLQKTVLMHASAQVLWSRRSTKTPPPAQQAPPPQPAQPAEPAPTPDPEPAPSPAQAASPQPQPPPRPASSGNAQTDREYADALQVLEQTLGRASLHTLHTSDTRTPPALKLLARTDI